MTSLQQLIKKKHVLARILSFTELNYSHTHTTVHRLNLTHLFSQCSICLHPALSCAVISIFIQLCLVLSSPSSSSSVLCCHLHLHPALSRTVISIFIQLYLVLSSPSSSSSISCCHLHLHPALSCAVISIFIQLYLVLSSPSSSSCI